MQQASIKGQINKELEIMPVNLQQKVLDFVTRLAQAVPPKRKDGEKLAKLAGLISHEEAEELTEIINANCEQIDNEW
jgi:hypothetical protein